MTEDEMVGWLHRLDGHGFGWTLGVGDGQGGLVCCGSWGHKELDTTEGLNRTEELPKRRGQRPEPCFSHSKTKASLNSQKNRKLFDLLKNPVLPQVHKTHMNINWISKVNT